MSLFTERLVVWSPGGPTGEYDEYGLPVNAPPSEVVFPAWYEPAGSSEDTQGRVQQVYGYNVYFPRGSAVDSESRVKIAGAWYEVDGEPGEMPDGFILEGYLTLTVKKVTG